MVMHRLTALAIVTVSAAGLRFGLIPAVDRIISPTGNDFVIMAAEAEIPQSPVGSRTVPTD